MRPMTGQGRGLWRALGLFWLIVVLTGAGVVGVLAWLGQPEPTSPRHLIPAPVDAVAPEAVAPLPTAPPADPPFAVTPPEQPAAALPEAPEPPPLPGAEPVATAAEHAIPTPDPALLEDSPDGPLPRIGADGRQARHAYARRFDRADTRPRIGLVMPGASVAVLPHLPGAIALALPNAAMPLLEMARARGMETLLLLPTDPAGLNAALAHFSGYVGATGPDIPIAIQDVLRDRGLLFLNARAGAPPPSHAWGRTADLVLEDAPTRGEIDRQLQELERLARERGSALGILPVPRPLFVERLAAWALRLPENGLVLAPVTAMIRRPASAQR
jgi:polysaccharide deacetylase 2 family uncharacterized protein YibQ